MRDNSQYSLRWLSAWSPVGLFITIIFSCTFFLSSAFAQFPEYFDSVTAPDLPSGWTSTRSNTSTPFWVTSVSGPHTIPNATFINDPAGVTDASLITPVFLFNGNGPLRFRHRFGLETNFDGGVLEIKIGAGSFQDIITAGGSFVQNGYNGTISLNFQNPLAGRSAWTGSFNANFQMTVVNLPAAANNQNIQLRWRRGTDTSVSGAGWTVDSIEFGSAQSDIVVSKADSVDPIIGGNQFTYTISVINNGPAVAEQVQVEDLIPLNFSLSAIDSTSQGTSTIPNFNQLSTNFGTIAAGASAQVVLRISANFNTPNPSVLSISSPASIARDYVTARAQFGESPGLPGVTAPLVLVQDGVGDVNDGCEPLSNGTAINSKIAVLRQTNLCQVDIAVSRAEGAGALAVVILKTTFDLLNINGSGVNITIPVVGVNSRDADTLVNALGGSTVVGTVGILQDQLLNVAYASTASVDPNLNNNIGVQYTAFLNDGDADTLPDVQDNCPLVSNLDQANLDGDAFGDLCDTCTDTDGDGSGNSGFILNTCSDDGCPTDAGKIFPGVCGCGVSDTDSDNDSQPDCFDGCPFDGSRTVPGICGCGAAEVDTNANGILDCLKNPELRFRLTAAQSAVRKLKSLSAGDSKKKAAQKRLRKDLKNLNNEIKGFIQAGGIQPADASQDLSALANNADVALRKAGKAKGKSLGKSKKVALQALAQLITGIAS